MNIYTSTCCAGKHVLATCVNYAKINYSMLHMHGLVSARFLRGDVLFLQGKHSGFSHIVASV